MLYGYFPPDANVVTAPPLMGTLFTVPPLSVQYTLVESTAMSNGGDIPQRFQLVYNGVDGFWTLAF
jgi:hypothetical protein